MSDSPLRKRIDEAVAAIRAKDPRVPSMAVVLGSGLGAYADSLVRATRIPFDDIPHQPRVGVVGHAGALVLGEVPNAPAGRASPVVAALSGRVHAYEGHDSDTVVFAVRVMVTLGAKVVLLTNAAGGISPTARPGDLVLITDHLNFQGRNPLVGPNDDSLGPRFPDMSTTYDPGLRATAQRAAEAAGTVLREGVYAAMLGPSYETPAEIRMLRAVGADLVGMSTVLEAIAARHMGARVLGISCVTNLAAGVSPTPLSHEEVELTAREARGRFVRVLEGTLHAIASGGR